jgi:hypothetical protein
MNSARGCMQPGIGKRIWAKDVQAGAYDFVLGEKTELDTVRAGLPEGIYREGPCTWRNLLNSVPLSCVRMVGQLTRQPHESKSPWNRSEFQGLFDFYSAEALTTIRYGTPDARSVATCHRVSARSGSFRFRWEPRRHCSQPGPRSGCVPGRRRHT